MDNFNYQHLAIRLHACMQACFIIAGLIWHSPSLAADMADEYIELTAGYSRGSFNTGQIANLYRAQVAYGKIYDSYDINITVPYLFLNDNLGDDSGMGDIILRSGKTLGERSSSDNKLYASISLKLPTADESRGLGTGETDAGGFLSYSHHFNEMNLTLTGGYIITGDSAIQSYEDIVVYGAGLSQYVNPWYIYGSLDGHQQTLATGSAPLELSAGLLYQIKLAQFLKAEGFIGLNNDSPDFGLAIGLINWF